MYVSAIWRYPVKSLAGESLTRAELTVDGIAGDRRIHVRGARRPLTGRTRPGLMTLPATTDDRGRPLVAGHPWDSPEAAVAVRRHAGDDAALVASDRPERFDVTNLLVAADGSVAAFGHDVRRLRPNLLLGGVPEGAEAAWPGKAIRIGSVVIGVHSLRERCVATAVDPDTGVQDLDVFRRIRDEFDNRLGLNCWVIRGGHIRVGDPAALVTTEEQPTHLGGWVAGAPYDAGPGRRTVPTERAR